MAEKKQTRLACVFGENIVKQRQLLGWTQAELAGQLNMAPDALSRIENGFVAPRFPRIDEIAKLLDCSVAELFRSSPADAMGHADLLFDILTPLPLDQQKDAIEVLKLFVHILKKKQDGALS